MKKTVFSLILLFSLVLFNSCKKDDPVDPCEGISCENGGVCVNGACDCTDGYDGPDCSDQITPVKIRISKIEVTRFPATDSNGGGWDLTSGPDIYPELFKNDTSVWMSSIYYENATQTTYSFDLNPVYDITSPYDEYVIRLYDYDDIQDDFMGGIIFTPYFNTNGFPSIINLDANGVVAFKLHVTYIW